MQIREFRLNKFEDAQKENTLDQFGVDNNIKGSPKTENSYIQFYTMPKAKATAMAECLENQLSPIDTDDVFRSHCKEVRRGVQLRTNTSFSTTGTCCQRATMK